MGCYQKDEHSLRLGLVVLVELQVFASLSATPSSSFTPSHTRVLRVVPHVVGVFLPAIARVRPVGNSDWRAPTILLQPSLERLVALGLVSTDDQVQVFLGQNVRMVWVLTQCQEVVSHLLLLEPPPSYGWLRPTIGWRLQAAHSSSARSSFLPLRRSRGSPTALRLVRTRGTCHQQSRSGHAACLRTLRSARWSWLSCPDRKQSRPCEETKTSTS